MRWIEVSVDTPAELIDERCQQMADMGADGFVIENEADFQNFLENNHQYWDYVDDELEQKFAGVSRIVLPQRRRRRQGHPCENTRRIRRGADSVYRGQRLGEQLARIL